MPTIFSFSHVLLLYQTLTLCLFFRMSYFHKKKWNTGVFSICILRPICVIHSYLTTQPTSRVSQDLAPNPSTQNQRSSSTLICVPPLPCNTSLIRDILHRVVKSYRITISHIYFTFTFWKILYLVIIHRSLGYILGYIHTRAIINIEMVCVS